MNIFKIGLVLVLLLAGVKTFAMEDMGRAMDPQAELRAAQKNLAIAQCELAEVQKNYFETSQIIGPTKEAHSFWTNLNIGSHVSKEANRELVDGKIIAAAIAQNMQDMCEAIKMYFKPETVGLPEVHLGIEQVAASVMQELNENQKFVDIRSKIVQATQVWADEWAKETACGARRQRFTRYALIAGAVAVAAALATFGLYKMVQWYKESKEEKAVAQEAIE